VNIDQPLLRGADRNLVLSPDEEQISIIKNLRQEGHPVNENKID